MKPMALIGAVILAFILGFFVAAPIAEYMGGNAMTAAIWTSCISLAIAFIPGDRPKGVAFMAVQVEVWQKDIVENLFASNDFLLKSTDASQYILSGKVVHIPQAGSVPGVEKDRSSLPATAAKRNDSDVTYTLGNYTTDPFLLTNPELAESSYDKRKSLIYNAQQELGRVVAEDIIAIWRPAVGSNTIRTTGEDADTHLDGTTGTRKKLTTKDVLAANTLLNKQNVPQEDRYALIDAVMHDQLVESLSVTQFRDFSASADPKTGKIGRLYGFDFYMRSTMGSSYLDDGNGTITSNAYQAAANANDCSYALFWQIGTVERAVGPTLFRERLNDPTYYGDVYSLEQRMGGRKRRSDGKGVVAVVQALGGAN